MSLNWNTIRPLNNSLNDGFEELVCQLANKERFAGQKKFWRIGKPDGGKECYWEFENGEMHQWQAKYFTTSLSNTQWSQIDESVRTAIDAHSNLKKYFVALPIDMPDAKVKGKKSMLDKWKAKEQEWISYATRKGMNTSFEYWGSSELISRLSKRESEGLKYFWFNQEEFLDEWFDNKNKDSINNLGARYTKKLNFELPIAKIFDGLSRDINFEKQIHFYYKKLLEKYRSIRISLQDKDLTNSIKQLTQQIIEFQELYESVVYKSNDIIPFNLILDFLSSILNLSHVIGGRLYELRDNKERENEELRNQYSRLYSNETQDMYNFRSALDEMRDFIKGTTCKLANQPYLMITGEAGIGKSHLLADVVNKRKERNQQSLLLLGENFSNREMPWTQILSNQLRKNTIDEFTFLGALNAKAESNQSRIIIFIDALNEGEGRYIWINRLKSFIESFQKYPWLGLVISIRESYAPLLAPESEINQTLIARVIHDGFAGNEYEAVRLFFKEYKIIQPSSPFLNPEFQNPLFLKLFCQALNSRGVHELPEGYEGITTIINYFLESINIKLAKPTELYFDEKKQLLQKAVHKLIENIVLNNLNHVEYNEANEIVDSVFKSNCSNQEPFLKRLIAEGVLNKDLYWSNEGKDYDVVYFAYQRFQDHLTVSLLLDKHFVKESPEKSFESGKLYNLISDSRTALRNQNLIEAISVQLPERIGKELFEIAPFTKEYYAVADSFINSLIWRKSDCVQESSLNYINEVIIHDEELFSKLLNIFIGSSMKSDFFFNAESLHTYLLNFSIAERDKLWTIWLQDKYGDYARTNAVKRLIDWAWNEDDKEFVNDESLLLGCLTLSWFLTSSNRYLRDAATKALISLLQFRTHLISSLLEKFKNINDPYVLERLYAVAYGCSLRTTNLVQLKSLSEYVYKAIFNRKNVYPHILLRDYARGIIEFAKFKNLNPKVKIKKVRPPYQSKPLPKKFPSSREINKNYKPKRESGQYDRSHWGVTAILESMNTTASNYGDFGRYRFKNALEDWQVSSDGLSSYAVQLIFELGYDPKLFSEFDSQQGSGRSAGFKERIGKKYQWIVFHELLARVSDQCVLIDESSSTSSKKIIAYQGPWQFRVRDIDPSIIINQTLEERYNEQYTNRWWFTMNYNNWQLDNKAWMKTKTDLPEPKSIIEVIDEKGESWIWLEIHPDWNQPEELGADRWQSQRKRLYYQIRSYLIKPDELDAFKNITKGDFHEHHFPRTRYLTSVFSHEYYWSSAYNFFNKFYYSGETWTPIYQKGFGKIIGNVCRTTESYDWEEEYDRSKTQPIRFYKPVQLIQEALQMKVSFKEGEFLNEKDQLICFDPSVNNKSISGLLVKKNELITWLKSQNLCLVWSVVGEKQVLGHNWKKGEYPGRLDFSGLYVLNGGIIEGGLQFKSK